jgi:phenylalanine-4-hydroxylase
MIAKSGSKTEATFLTQQRWNDYTPDQHQSWSLLFARRVSHLQDAASRAFLDGMTAIGLQQDALPDLEQLNGKLEPITGWCALPVKGFLPAHEFFSCLAIRRFPTTVTIRRLDRLDYVPEPDIFHDVFGHVPMHANPVFAEFLQRFGRVAAKASRESEIAAVTRLFWFTVEFGLIEEEGRKKVYGSGLISSHADCLNALGENCQHEPFTLDRVIATDFRIDNLQPRLFVLRSYEQLFEAVKRLESDLEMGSL